MLWMTKVAEKFQGWWSGLLKEVRTTFDINKSISPERKYGFLPMRYKLFFVFLAPLLAVVLTSLGFYQFGSLFSRYVFWPLFIPFMALAITFVFAARFFMTDLNFYYRLFPLLWGVVLAPVFSFVGIKDVFFWFNLLFFLGFVRMLERIWQYFRFGNDKNRRILHLIFIIVIFYFSSEILGGVLIGSFYSLF